MKKALPGSVDASVDAELEEMKKLMGDGDGKDGKGDGKE